MTGLKIQLTIFLFLASACAIPWGSPSPDFDDYPIRSDMDSVWHKCKDVNPNYACKNVCKEFDRKNRCKEGMSQEIKVTVKKLLDNDFWISHKSKVVKCLGVR